MKIIIEVNEDGGVQVSGGISSTDPYKDINANIVAVGVLEIAKASLLARRWGINLKDGNKNEPFKEDKNERGKK